MSTAARRRKSADAQPSAAVQAIINALVERFDGHRTRGAVRCTCPYCAFPGATFTIKAKTLNCPACRRDNRAGAAKDHWTKLEAANRQMMGNDAWPGVGKLVKHLGVKVRKNGQDHRDQTPDVKLSIAVVEANGSGIQDHAEDDDLEQIACKVQSTIDTMRETAIGMAVDIGGQLRAAQKLLAGKGRDGEFRPWLKRRLSISHTTAYKWIALAEFADKCKSGLHFFDVTAAYLLTSDKCPEAATSEAVKQAAKGTKITPKVAREIISRHTKSDDDGQCPSAPTESDGYKSTVVRLHGLVDELTAADNIDDALRSLDCFLSALSNCTVINPFEHADRFAAWLFDQALSHGELEADHSLREQFADAQKAKLEDEEEQYDDDDDDEFAGPVAAGCPVNGGQQ